MEIKIKPNYASVDYKNIPGTYTFYQNLTNNETWIYSSVDIPVNTNIRVTQDGGNIAFGTIQSSTPFFALYILVIKRTQGNIIGSPNVILSIDEIVESASFYLDGTIEILLNYKIFDLKDLKRSTPFTKTIDVPFTDNNNKIFSQIFNVNVTQGFNPKKKSDCEITDGGVLIVSGYLQVQEIDLPNELYKCVFYGEFKNLFDDIGDNLIFGNLDSTKDLNFSDILHDKVKDEIISSWNGNKEFIYGVVNTSNSNWVSRLPIRSENLYPFTKVKYVWDKIFNKYGYSYESDFLNSDLFNNLLILPSLRKPSSIGTSSAFLEWGYNSAGTMSIATATYSTPTQFTNWKEDTISFDKEIVDVFGGQFTSNRFRINFDANSIKVDGRLNFDADGPNQVNIFVHASPNNYIRPLSTIKIVAEIYKSNSLFNSVVIASKTEELYNGVTVLTSLMYKIRDIRFSTILSGNFKVGDFIIFKVKVETDGGRSSVGPAPIDNPYWDYYFEKFDLSSNTTNFIRLSSSIMQQDIISVFTGIKQVDIISDITKMYNLYIKQDKIDVRKFLIEPRDNFYEKGNIVDYLSYDVESLNLSFLTDIAAKNYTLTYKKGDDLRNSNFQDQYKSRIYGDALINLDFDFLNNNKKIEITAQPTFMDNLNGNYHVPSQIPKTESDDNIGFGHHYFYYSGTQSYLFMTTPPVFTLNTGLTSSSLFSPSYFPKIDIYSRYRGFSSESLLFGEPTKSDSKGSSLYYNYYQNEIETYAEPLSHILSIDVYMSTNIFNRINFNDVFYFEVNGNGQYYILLSIENYNPAQAGMVTMKFLSYYIFKNRPKRDTYIFNPDIVVDVDTGGGNSDLTTGKDNFIGGDTFKYQVAGQNNIIDQGKQSVFVYGDGNNIKTNNVVTYESGKTYSTANTFYFGDYNPILKDKDYLGVSAAPGMIVYGGTSSLYIRGIDNNWWKIDLTKAG